MESLAVISDLLRQRGRLRDADEVQRRAEEAQYEPAQALQLWLWLAELSPPHEAVGAWDQAVAAYGEAVRDGHTG